MRSGGGRDFRRQRTIDAFVAAFNDAQPDVDRVLSLFADDVRHLPGHGPGRRTRAPPIRPVPMNARCRSFAGSPGSEAAVRNGTPSAAENDLERSGSGRLGEEVVAGHDVVQGHPVGDDR
ncbi:hypothetical protein Acsp01_80060 [Actinoplanes sp. NBRC 101535]|nr:hypothetical protein Acsp01_80060 [Actinoplanes sp. NBRC 101535]